LLDNEDKNIILLEAVRKEARDTFLRKYNQACIQFLWIVNKIRTSNLKTPEETLKFAQKELNRLISSQRSLENFYRFVFDLIKDKIVHKDRLIEIPSFLSDYGLNIASSMSNLGKRTIVVDLDDEKLEVRNRIYEIIQDIQFEQFRDLEIFCEAAAHSLEEEAELLTGDKGFYNNALLALEKLRQEGYNPELKVILVRP